MKFLKMLSVFSFALFSLSAVAGGGHNHDHDHGHSHSHEPVNMETAKQNAKKIVVALAKRGVVDKSWSSIAVSTVEKKVFKGNPEWVAMFVNKSLDDVKKQKLYIFLTLGGDYIAANYSGK